MKKFSALLLCIVFVFAYLPVQANTSANVTLPFSDVTPGKWYYEAIAALYSQGVIDPAPAFYPKEYESRANVVYYLYEMHKSLGRKVTTNSIAVFDDVPKGNKYYDAVCWAYQNGIASGVSKSHFGPDQGVTREQVATFLIRYANKFKVNMVAVNEPDQFIDSLSISSYARSAVTACKVGGIINGYENGYFYPKNSILRSEVASIVYKFSNTAKSNVSAGKTVKTAPNFYDSLYESYKTEQELSFVPRVKQSSPVNVSYFDDCAFIGDSVTRTLFYYNQKTNAMNNAKFFFSESLSARTAILPVSSNSEHPTVNNAKVLVEDAVAASGANKVYIMLGMYGMSYGAEEEIENTKLLVERIRKKSPNVKIFIQSVTPLANGAKKSTTKYNNEKIAAFNALLEEECRENGWYYINVTETLADIYTGYLLRSYCYDLPGQGAHLSDAGCAAWVDYLKTHVPNELK